jgi:DNA-directed RNA polymerase specialized sigma24 family protein
MGEWLMDADRGAPNGQGQDIDQESLFREIASLRTYLLFVAGRFKGIDALPGVGVSDLVDSVIGDAFAEIQHGGGHFTFKTDNELRSWLVKRLEWTYKSWLRRRGRYNEILRNLPPHPVSRTPGSELMLKELADARAKLDPADRQLIKWRVDDGLTFEAIGRQRGCSTSRARRAFIEAIERLKTLCPGLARPTQPRPDGHFPGDKGALST